ncbi:MAG TPA: type IX secretion system membrane protein PorP/SprF [Lentimicrobium sp.]|nr:type IX secretion system membrane protein PorP/SprF [Lentimicrobium sp.]
MKSIPECCRLVNISKALVLILLNIPLISLSQQEPQFTLNSFNHMAVNPGYAGLRDAICVTGIIRQQWVGLNDEENNHIGPETFVVSGDAPVRLLHGGVSAVVMQDKIGYFKDVYVKLGYSYNKSLAGGELGIGFNVGFLNKSLDFSKLKPVEQGDPILGSSEESTMFTDLNFGAFYTEPGGLYLGLSATQLLEGARNIGDKLEYNLKRHYYGTAGYEISWIRNPAYVFTPSVFVKFDGVTTQVDLNALIEYNRKVWGGLTYRLQETTAVMIGLNIKDLSLGYAYDIPLSKIGGAGSHEVMVRYCFKLELEKTKKSFRNTRFL